MALQFEEQLLLPIDVLNENEGEKILTKTLKMHLLEIYGTVSLTGGQSKKKAAVLGLLVDLDRHLAGFLKEYFSGA